MTIRIEATGKDGRTLADNRQAKTAAAQADALLTTLTTGWAALNTAQRADALRDAVVLLLKIAKGLMRLID